MACGQARVEHLRTGLRVKILDRYGGTRSHPLWNGIPYIASALDRGQFAVVQNGPGVRPYHLGKTDQRWTYNLSFRPTVGEIAFTREEEAYGQRYRNRVILEPHIKAKASPNKQWKRWAELAGLMREAGIPVSQVGPVGTAVLEEAEMITCPDFRHAAAVLKYAKAAVLPDGGLHHAAAAVGLPAVVLMGGFTPVECTGYEGHINIGASGSDACGMRTPCSHCERWMASIKVETVFAHLMSLLQ